MELGGLDDDSLLEHARLRFHRAYGCLAEIKLLLGELEKRRVIRNERERS